MPATKGESSSQAVAIEHIYLKLTCELCLVRRVQLLGLQAVSTPPATSARSALYTAAVLQHAALLLLLLVSNSAVFVLPTEGVSPTLLQLLHLLSTVYHALIRDGSGQADTSALAQLLAGRQQPVQLHIALQVITPTHSLAMMAPTHMACIQTSTGVVLV